jgi:hypothetical protein
MYLAVGHNAKGPRRQNIIFALSFHVLRFSHLSGVLLCVSTASTKFVGDYGFLRCSRGGSFSMALHEVDRLTNARAGDQ